ncbi:MAG: Phosphoribosylglycinamide formyltransferase [Myxococcaceae bacterium]|nr:Phosphoribosylglycinamide formyltransferase [Myxococcaceae bacterium]
MTPPLKLAVLVSGRGSNLAALLQAIDQGSCHARVSAVLADRHNAPALELARSRGIDTHVVAAKEYRERADWDRELTAQIATSAPDLVVLAGFMRLIGSALLERYAGRIINVHPALLPAFPGLDAPAQAVVARVCISGCTVHVVDAGVDTGPVLAQAAVPVLPSDDASSLHARIQRAEHALLPAVVNAVARGTLLLGTPPRYADASLAAGTNSLVWPPLL